MSLIAAHHQKVNDLWVGTPPNLCVDFSQATLEPATIPFTAGVSRASTGTVVDYEGRVIEVPENVPRVQGARYIRNWSISDDAVNDWYRQSGNVTLTQEGDETLYSLSATVGRVIGFQLDTRNHPLRVGETIIWAVRIRTISDVYIKTEIRNNHVPANAPIVAFAERFFPAGSEFVYCINYTVTGEEQITGDEPNPTLSISLWNYGSQTGDLFYFKEARVTRIFGSNIADEWIPAGTCKPVNYYNGGKLDTERNWLIERQGARLPGPFKLLEEPAATNYVRGSIPTALNWNLGANTNAQENAAIAPDGTKTALLLPVGGIGQIINPVIKIGVADQPQTITGSVYIKFNAPGEITIRCGHNDSDTKIQIDGDFNVLSKGPLVEGVDITPIIDGWRRVSIASTETAPSGDRYVTIVKLESTSEILIWGSQGEIGSVPTSYIPNSGTAVTRAAETVNEPVAAFTRASTATVLDYEGRVIEVPENAPRFEGARYVRNEVVSLLTSLWGSGSTTTEVPPPPFAPSGSDNAIYVEPTGPASGFVHRSNESGARPVPVGTVTVSAWLKGDIGGEEIRIFGGVATSTISGYPITLTTDWRRYSVTLDVLPGSTQREAFVFVCEARLQTPFTIWGMQTEYGKSFPSEQLSVGERKAFPYANGNTVDPATKIVTEAKGAPLPNIAYPNEPAATNINPQSRVKSGIWAKAGNTVIEDDAGPEIFSGLASTYISSSEALSAYISVWADNTTDYTFSCYVRKANTSSVTLSLGPNMICVRVTYNFDTKSLETLTVGGAQLLNYGAQEGPNGSIRLWVSGRNISADGTKTNIVIVGYAPDPNDVYVEGVQFEVGQRPTSYIPTAGAQITRAADDLLYTGVPNGDITLAIDWKMDYARPSAGNWRLFGSTDNRAGRYEIRTYGHNYTVAIYDGGFTQEMSSVELSGEGFYSYAGAYEDGRQDMYINGALVSEYTHAITLDHSNQGIKFGRWSTTSTTIPLYFSKAMLFDKALFDAELKLLTNHQKQRCTEETS
jgi:hypothetical protein